jgi:hypothetical protein
MLKRTIVNSVAVAIGGLVLVTSCGEDSRGVEYMPDMYRGPAVETYQPLGEDGHISAMKPVEGTMPRGFMAYQEFAADQAGYDAAKEGLKMPANFPKDEKTMEEAATLYAIFCGHCHGVKGDGKGILVEREKFLGVPSYADRDINAGTIFHVVTYGKGVMGSHASQLTPKERWMVTNHVLKLKAELAGGGTSAKEETTGTDSTTAVADTTAASEQITN